jgi:predicted PurR-regulated permease PerM
VLWGYLAVAACWLVSIYAVTVRAVAAGDIHLVPGGDLRAVDNPAGSSAWLGSVEGLILPVLAAFWLAFVVSQVLAWRRADGERRQQLKWLMSGAAFCAAGVAVSALVGTLDTSAPSPALTAVIYVVFLGVAALPVSIGVAILKYRLYDIDRIISRTLAYAIVTGLLVGVYAGLVLLATGVFKFHSTVAVAAATLAAAALFNPVRRRVQRRVDHRFHRARYDADQMVAAFAARLKDTVDLDSVRDDLTGLVHRALEPAHVSVWVNDRG